MTAVEYIEKKLQGYGFSFKDIIDGAKEMEKQQIIDAHGIKKDYSFSQIDPTTITGEQYYNETFKNK